MSGKGWAGHERKEGSVCGYEADDGVNRTLIMTIALTLAGLFSIGRAGCTSTSQVQAEFGDVSVQENNTNFLKQIRGDAADLAMEALPRTFYDPLENLEEDFVKIDGFDYPLKVFYVGFTAEAKIGEINALLRDLDAEIVGVLPGRTDIPLGLSLILRVPTESYDELHTLVDEVRNSPIVRNAVEYVLQNYLNFVPQPSDEWGGESSRSSFSLNL